MKHKIFSLLLTLLLSFFNVHADDGNWSFDSYDFQYDMTAYVGLSVDGSRVNDLGQYKISAFFGEQCRGIMEVKTAGNNGNVQYGYLRIRSNQESGELITFKVLDTRTGAILKCDNTLEFVSQAVEGLPSSPMVLKAANKYKVEYMVFDQVFSTEEVYYGDEVPEVEAPQIEGYTFVRWNDLPETMPAKNLTITSSYSVNSYTLTFLINGEVMSEQTVEYASTIVAPEAPQKEGYTFNGWEDYPETMPANDLTITGSYTLNSYKLTYVIDDQVIEKTEVGFGTTIEAINAPEKEGYAFNGWVGLPETMPARDVTVTGSYTINSYTLTFKVGNDIVSQTVVEYGSKIVEPVPPEKEGFTFDGWEEYPETMPAHDLTINGHYADNSYKLTYVIDGEVIAELEVEFATILEAIEAPVKEGYTFNGWVGLPETMPAQGVTVTGSYTINSYTLTFKIQDEVLSEAVVEYASTIVAPEAPQKEGYTFDGWEDYPETMPANDLTITGSYTLNSYKLTYVIDDQVIEETEVGFGTTIEAINAPEKEGYTFDGWLGLPETMPAQDVIVRGSYTINSYTLIFKIDDEVVSETVVEYASTIVAPETPQKEGYTFEGWEDYPETMPAENLTINGSYTVNVYTVTYMIDDEVIRVDNVEYGQTLPGAPEAPEKPDYRFVGWSEVPSTMPAQDIIVVGMYEEAAGLNAIYTDSVPVDIFDIQGRLIKKGIAKDRISDYVPSGLYIVNGTKVLVK